MHFHGVWLSQSTLPKELGVSGYSRSYVFSLTALCLMRVKDSKDSQFRLHAPAIGKSFSRPCALTVASASNGSHINSFIPLLPH